NSFLQGAWALLMSRYSGQEDIVFGAVTSGRPTTLARAESMVGLFINTVPIRIQVSPEESLLPLLYKIQEFVVEVGQYEYCPLIKIQGWSEIAKGFPLFESLVVFENYVVDESLKQNNINLEIEGSHGFERTNYPITLIVVPDQKISLRILVNDTSRFDHNTLTQMLGHLKNLLEGMVANQQQRIGDLLMLSEAEQQKLLVEWNDTAVPYSQEKCIHQLFEAQVAKTPDAVAVVFEKQTLTYTELNTKANQLAHYLQQLGVNPEILVGICVERSFEMVIGLLAILKAGGAYVPLDPNYPLERLSYMLEDSQPRVLLTQEHLLERLPNHQAQVICLDNDWEKISTNSTVNPESNITIDNLAYVIYTSGSTGKPKGAMNNHSGILNRLLWMQDTYQLTSVDAVLQKTPFSFDVSVWEFFWTLMSGARLVVARPNGHKDPDYLVKLISQQQITTLHFVPSMLQVFLEARDVEQCQSIRQVIASGEALPAQLQHRFWQRLDSRLDNLYGPTEAAVDVTYWQCQKDNQKQKTVPIGRPIANIQVYLLDDDLNPVPVGVTGELYLGGVGVGRGYFNRPDLTAEKFIPHPFSNHTVDRLYKTGDLAHYLPNGDIEYIGRIDNQVKVRGFRIELGEIEAMITQHPAVRETVVIAREESDNAKRLVAYVVSRQESTLTISALREFLESKLPDYMVPSAWVTLETLPLTPNGKVDRKALPEPSNLHNLSNDYIPPRNDTEATIINIWQQLLETQKIGIKDNFFEIGGHSLIATRVISQIRQIFQVELPLRSIFEHPTVTGLAQEIEQGIKSDSGISLTPIKKVSRSEKLPLSFAQQRLWVLSQLEPDSPAYNIPAAFRLQGKLDVSALVKTFSTIIQRHEILRTTVTQVEDELVQIIHPQVDFQPVVIDIANLHQNLQDQEIKELVEKEAAQPFDLAKDLLLRVTLIKLTDIEHIVLFTMHHVISDGWSMGILVNEFSAIYKAFVEGEPSPLPKLTLQYLDYAVWQREWLQGDVLDKQLSYWKQQLGNNLSVLELAIANPQPEGRTFRGGQQKIRIDKDLSQNLQNLSTENGVTLFMTLLAAFKTLLHWYSNQEDIVVGTDIANRHQGEIENLIGFFVNQLVLRTDLSGNPTFKELLAKVRQVTLDAYANQDLPFNKLVEVLNPKRNLNYTPLFQVKMILQNTPIPALELPDLQLTSIEVDKKKTVENDLLLAIEDTGAGLNCLLKYDVDLFSSNNMAELLENLELILSEIARQPELRLDKIKSILAKAEENRQQTREHDYQNTLMQKLKKVRRRSLN
ncbi:MAG: amino acid adenylation domain-containing protein, partial [Cyanobacteria bacterium P01_F01_bin.143]